MAKDPQALAAEQFMMFNNSKKFIQRENPNLSLIELEDRAMEDMIRRSRSLPSQRMLNMLAPERREQVSESIYWGAVNQIVNDPDVQREIGLMARRDGLDMSLDGVDAALIHYALRTVTNDMGGYTPNDEVRDRVMGLEGAPISDDLMSIANQMFGVKYPNEVTPAMRELAAAELKKNRLDERYQTKYLERLAAEAAESVIRGADLGKKTATATEHEIETTKTKAREKPIDPKIRAEAGVPKQFETYLDLLEAGYRLLTPQDQKAYDSIRDVMEVVKTLEDLAGDIFTSEDDYYSRTKHGIYLKQQQAWGTDLGVKVTRYQAARQTMTRLLLQLMGEQGGRFTDTDQKQIMKSVAEIDGLIGGMIQIFPEGKKVAMGKMATLQSLLANKLSFIEAPRIIKMKPKGETEETHDFEITSDKKVK
jgi:hypothetical protein